MSIFDKKKEAEVKGKGAPLVMPQAEVHHVGVVAPPSTLDRLKTLRDSYVNELQSMNARVVKLDAQIAWLERFPQVEEILVSLQRMTQRQASPSQLT
jgi:hypothetical protein